MAMQVSMAPSSTRIPLDKDWSRPALRPVNGGKTSAQENL